VILLTRTLGVVTDTENERARAAAEPVERKRHGSQWKDGCKPYILVSKVGFQYNEKRFFLCESEST